MAAPITIPTNAMAQYRLLAADWAIWACSSTSGKKEALPYCLKSDPKYKQVTQGRDWKGYSSCGDLCHFVLWQLGVRLDLVNRDLPETVHENEWKVGVNISRLVYGTPKTAPRQGGNAEIEVGDILHINHRGTNQDHVMIALEWDARIGRLVVGEYGQPHGAITTYTVERLGDRRYVKKAPTSTPKELIHVIKLDEIILAAEIAGKLELAQLLPTE